MRKVPDIFKKIALFYESTKKLQKIMNTPSPSRERLSVSLEACNSSLLITLARSFVATIQTKRLWQHFCTVMLVFEEFTK